MFSCSPYSEWPLKQQSWSYEKKVVIFKKIGVTNGTYEAI